MTAQAAGLSADLAALFPPGVVAAELFGEVGEEVLTAEERLMTASYAPKRMTDFAGGRLCAHLALNELGWRDYSLLARPDRVPCWPADILGSITHTEGYCGAVAARTSEVLSVGLDCERLGAISSDIWDRIFLPEEQLMLRQLGAATCDAGAALVFAAKEAFYKCQYLLTGDWVGFEQVQIELSAASLSDGAGDFRVIARQPLRFQSVCLRMPTGRFLLRDRWLAAAIAVGAGSAA